MNYIPHIIPTEDAISLILLGTVILGAKMLLHFISHKGNNNNPDSDPNNTPPSTANLTPDLTPDLTLDLTQAKSYLDLTNDMSYKVITQMTNQPRTSTLPIETYFHYLDFYLTYMELYPLLYSNNTFMCPFSI